MAGFTPQVLRLLSVYVMDVVIREIDALFGDNDIRLGPEQPDPTDPSERRERMRRYLATLDLNNPTDHAKLVAVYSDVMQDIGERAKPGGDYYDLMPLKARWLNTLAGAGFEVDTWSFVVTDPARPTTSVTFTAEALAALSDPAVVHCKVRPTARGVAYTKSDDVTQLVARSQQALGLAARGASGEDQSLRRVLGSLATLAQNVTEIRNKIGVDHGAESVPTWVRPRHARLVVGAAQVWRQLMLETLGDPEAPWRAGHITGESH